MNSLPLSDGTILKKIVQLLVPVLWFRIHMFLGLPDPDPSLVVQIRILLFVQIRILASSSKTSKKNLRFLPFCDFFMTFYLRRMMEMYLTKLISKAKIRFFGILKVTDEKSRIRIRIRTKLSRIRNTDSSWHCTFFLGTKWQVFLLKKSFRIK